MALNSAALRPAARLASTKGAGSKPVSYTHLEAKFGFIGQKDLFQVANAISARIL